jgi:hypothetical protein
MNTPTDIQKYFNEHNYVIIKGFVDKNLANLFYNYCINKVKSIDFKHFYAKKLYDPEWDGNWSDPQAPDAYSSYGDTLMETLLLMSTNTIESYTGLKLVPNYSYWRFYQLKNELKRHVDRPSCEISTTLCLGYNVSNTEEDYIWPMYVFDPVLQEEVPAKLEPGDMIIYKGCEIEHWRDQFKGLNQAQVFLHYNDVSQENYIKFDGRPILAIPKLYQSAI